MADLGSLGEVSWKASAVVTPVSSGFPQLGNTAGMLDEPVYTAVFKMMLLLLGSFLPLAGVK